MNNYVSSFLMAHDQEIESASILADRLMIVFKSDVTVGNMIVVMADLINFCQPSRAHANLADRSIRLEF